MEIRPLKKFDKKLTCKPDKSVTHRAVMFNAAIENGRAVIEDPLISEDCLATADCMRRLGATVEIGENRIEVVRGGITRGAELFVGNSGTTMRLLSGLLSGINGKTFKLEGDESIARRPMNRVCLPLLQMGAKITSHGGYAPLEIEGGELVGTDYLSPVSSAQVKSAILLAGLNASGVTTVRESVKSRDHSERMLAAMGADITIDGNSVSVRKSRLHALDVKVCGDISSAAFAMALAAGKDGGRCTIANVGINPTRTGIIDVLKAMGASVEIADVREFAEPSATLTVKGRVCSPVTVGGELIPRLIDELPVIAVLCALVEGESVIKDAAELKVKETDRIATTAAMLRGLGAEVETHADGMSIFGKGYIEGGGEVDSKGDHRIAMAAAVAMSLSRRGGRLIGADSCAVSYPDFFETVL